MARLILVADDSPTIQRRAQGILQGEGFEVETVSNGVAAIKKLPKLQPILVLADVSMPGKDGYEVCEFVKTSADFRHVPVLLVASDLEPYDEQRGAQVAADGIIKKPFTPHDLIAMVGKFIGFGQAPAPQPVLPDTLVTSAPAAMPEVPPMGSRPVPSTGSEEQDLAALPGCVAFAGPPLDEIQATPAEPLVDISLQSSPVPALQDWAQSLPEPRLAAPAEEVLRGSSEPLVVPIEPFPGFGIGPMPEPTPEAMPEAAPEPPLVSPELVSETAPEAIPEPTLVTAGPTPEAMPETAPEPPLVSPELVSETAPEAIPEPTLVTPAPTREAMPEATPEPPLASPELISETAPEAIPEPTLVTPAPTREAAPEPPLASPELISETALETIPEPTLVTAGPTPEAAPGPPFGSPELVSETALEAIPEPTLVTAGPTPEAAPEPPLASPELISETAPKAKSEQVWGVSEPVAESGLPFAPESVTETVHLPAEAVLEPPPAVPVEKLPLPTELILAETQVEQIPLQAPSPDLVTPEADRTVAFRVPAVIAEPVLSDELTAAPPPPEPPPFVEGQHWKPMVATHLDSFSLAEAVAGQVCLVPPENEAGPAPGAEVVQSGEAPASLPSVVNPELVYVIVNKVVMKMAPPVLSPELIEQIVRTLTQEISSEINPASS